MMIRRPNVIAEMNHSELNSRPIISLDVNFFAKVRRLGVYNYVVFIIGPSLPSCGRQQQF